MFSTNLYTYSLIIAPINNWSNISTSTIVTDSTNWSLVKGSFIADSSYQYINIGNFYNNANTNIAILNPSSTYSYYYLDDVRVSTDSLFGLSIGLPELFINTHIGFYPNPTNGEIILEEIGTKVEDFTVVNTLGQIVFYSKYLNANSIDLSCLSDGVYNLSYNSNNKKISDKLIIKK